MEQAISIGGALLILAAYGANQMGWLGPSRPLYNVLNLVGAVILTVIAFRGSQWGFVLMESVWAVISVPPLVRSLRA